MKQKLVIQVDMFDEKRRSKAMKIVVGTEGLVSVALNEDKKKLVVIGENMDAFELVTSLRKKHIWVQMESLVEEKSEKKDEEKEVKKPEENKPVQHWPCIYPPTVPQHIFYQPAVSYNPEPCSLM